MGRLAAALLLLSPFVSACCVRTAIVDADAHHAKLVEARKTCWELPRETVFETAKATIASYRSYTIREASLEKGLVETFDRDDPAQPGGPLRSHRIVVKLETEGSCTRVSVSAPVQRWTKRDGYYELGEQSEGILYDAQLKIDEALRAKQRGPQPPPPPTPP